MIGGGEEKKIRQSFLQNIKEHS